MSIQEKNIYNILGKYVDDPEVIEFLALLSVPPLVHSNEFSESYEYSYSLYGITLHFENCDDYLSTIFLCSEHVYADHGFYTGEFPFGLGFECVRSEVRMRLGMPTHSSGDVYLKEVDSPQVSWDRYDGDEVVTHYTYSGPSQNIYMITLMTTDEAP